MKKLFIIYSGVVLLLLAACEPFLEEENYTSIVADNLYATKTGYEGLVNSCYSSLRDIYGEEPWLFCAGTDMYVEGKASQPAGLSEYQALTATDGSVLSFYQNLYKSIQLCNTAIYYNDKTETYDALSQRVAEAQFIRALAYFKLVQHFGGVSIIKQMIDEPVTSFARNSSEEVYEFIIEDLEDALAGLPVEPENFGRPTKGAANHFLAKVYLTRGYESFGTENDFTTAANYAEDAINGKGLNLTYHELFSPGNENNEEILFSVQYDKVSMLDLYSDGNRQNYYFGANLGANGNAAGYPARSYNLCPTMYVYNLYNEYDSRWEASFMNIIYERYYDYYDRPDELDQLVVTQYYPQSWEVENAELWQEESVLRSQAVIYPYSPNWVASPATLLNRETPCVKKFDDPTSYASGFGSNSRDIFLARLGETYLIAAEAYFKAGDLANAARTINVVRTRAAKSGKEAEMQISANGITINTILDERALELLGEYHRWEDLKRTGTLIERTKMYNRDIKEWFDNGTNPFEGVKSELKLLRPIPQQALDLNQNKDFGQNPGY
jgi:hypothetical protein